MKFESNLSLTEAAMRYVVMMIFPIAGGMLGSVWIMLLGIPFFLTGITGYCPIYDALGINHVGNQTPYATDEKNSPAKSPAAGAGLASAA